jgi:DNA polymerase III delta prime subunit
VAPPLRLERDRSPILGVLAEKLEENAEELVELLLKAARAGEWRVVGMMWDRVFGRPKETVEHQTEEPEAVRALRALTPEQRLELWRRRGVHVADEEPKTESA